MFAVPGIFLQAQLSTGPEGGARKGKHSRKLFALDWR